jgi:hypothetical protein
MLAIECSNEFRELDKKYFSLCIYRIGIERPQVEHIGHISIDP